MIKTFRDRETERIFRREFSRKLPESIQKIALRKLWMLNAATSLTDLKVPPANGLEALKRDREGQHSIRINRQWRICFRWVDQSALDVEITDYH